MNLMAKHKFKYEEDEFGVETEEELQAAFERFGCKTEEELDHVLWYTFGVSLINNIGK